MEESAITITSVNNYFRQVTIKTRSEQTVLREGTCDHRTFPWHLAELLVRADGFLPEPEKPASLVLVIAFSSLLAQLVLRYQLIQGRDGLKQGVLRIHFIPPY